MIGLRWDTIPGAVLRKLAARQVLTSGAGAAYLLQVREGAISVEFQGAHGRMCMAEVLGPGSTRLIEDLESEGERSWHPRFVFSAMIPSVVAEIPLQSVIRQVAAEPALLVDLLRAEQAEHEGLLARLALLRHPLRLPRVAASLLYLAEVLGVDCPVEGGVTLPVTQGVIAATADLARPTTNAALQRLAEARLIHIERGMICLMDREGLATVAAGEAEVAKRSGVPVVCRLRNPEAPGRCDAVQKSEKGRGEL